MREDDFDVGLIEGRAELLDRPASELLPIAVPVKYAMRLAAIGLDAATFAATYAQVIRIVPNTYLGWHGRTTPQSVRIAGAPAVSIDEPRRTIEGEPVARRARPQPRIVEPTRWRPSLRERLGVPLLRGFGAAPALTA